MHAVTSGSFSIVVYEEGRASLSLFVPLYSMSIKCQALEEVAIEVDIVLVDVPLSTRPTIKGSSANMSAVPWRTCCSS